MTVPAEPAPVAPATAIVFVAHGSRASAANDAHRAQATLLSDRTGLAVWPGFLELAEPSIPDAISAAAADAGRVLVLPYFLYPGRHVARDIPELVAQGARRHPEVEVQLLEAFGADPSVVDVLAQQVTAAFAAPGAHEAPEV